MIHQSCWELRGWVAQLNVLQNAHRHAHAHNMYMSYTHTHGIYAHTRTCACMTCTFMRGCLCHNSYYSLTHYPNLLNLCTPSYSLSHTILYSHTLGYTHVVHTHYTHMPYIHTCTYTHVHAPHTHPHPHPRPRTHTQLSGAGTICRVYTSASQKMMQQQLRPHSHACPTNITRHSFG